jgi:hypothetical protein
MNTLTCFGKDGRYSMTEGLQYTWMGTLDQRFVGTAPVVVFTPDCEFSEMRLFAEQQTAEGQIGHDIGSRTLAGPCGYACDMVELGPKFTLMTLRNYLWTGNYEQLQYFWPKVKKALQHQKDKADQATCLITGGQQTYDCTIFASSYSNGIWIASLLAGAELATIMNEPAQSTTYRTWYTAARASYESELWNESKGYFQMQRNDQTCMYDQLCGQMYADLLGLEKMFSADKIQRAAEYIPVLLGGKYGLKNGLRPDGSYPDGIACGGEPNGTWPGYPPAGYCSMAIGNGKPDLGLQWLKAIHTGIFEDTKRVWHQECKEDVTNGNFYDGNIHYMNLQAVWHVLYALTGANLDARGKRLWVRPNLPTQTTYMSNKEMKAPLAFPGSWGWLDYTQGATTNDQHIVVTFDSPRTFEKIIVRNSLASPTVSVYLNGSPLTCKVTKLKDDLVELALESPVSIAAEPFEIIMPQGPSTAVTRVADRGTARCKTGSTVNLIGLENGTLRYWLPSDGSVRLEVCRPDGSAAATLIDECNTAGIHNISLGERFRTSGTYIVRMRVNDRVVGKQLIAVR